MIARGRGNAPQFECELGLFGRDRADHAGALLGRRAFQLAVFKELLNDAIEHPFAFFNVGVFASLEDDRDLNLVLVLQEADRLLHFELDVVIARLGPQPNFFDLRLMDVLMRLLLFLVLELPEVHDAAYGRTLVRRNFHQVQFQFPGSRQRFRRGNDSQLLTVV